MDVKCLVHWANFDIHSIQAFEEGAMSTFIADEFIAILTNIVNSFLETGIFPF